MNLHVPLRCACPTQNQIALGAKYILTYMVTWGDYIEEISQLFNVSAQVVLDANGLIEDSIIYLFTPILVPLTSKPSMIELPMSPPPPPRSPPLEIFPVRRSNSSRKWVFVGVGAGTVLLFLVAFVAFLLWYFCRSQQRKSKQKPEDNDNNKWLPSFSSGGVECAVESLAIYKFSDISTATSGFSESNRIKGSIYKGCFNGDAAAVKEMPVDVSAEINFFKKINHINIIRLSGFCVQEGKSYLVYEFADNGSLDDWINLKTKQTLLNALSWRQRLQIAYDVADALNYLHNYTDPPLVHKNLTSSNILLDGYFRAKVSNFGLARSLVINRHDNQGGLNLTRHVVGTHGYMPPEYVENGLITPKLDVFAYGVVLLELISGKEALVREENGREDMLFALISQVLEEDNNVRDKFLGFIDPSLRNEFPLHVAFSLAQLAKSCVSLDLNERPTMSEVSMTMSKILSSSSD